MKRLALWSGTLILAGCMVPLCAGAQDRGQEARRVLDQMLEQYRESVADIDGYVVETDSYTAHYTKTDSEWPSFSMRVDPKPGAPRQIAQAASVSDPSLFDRDAFQKLRENAVYAGRQTVDGRSMHGIRAERIEGLFPTNDVSSTVENLLLVVDEETLDIDRMQARIQMPGPGGRTQTVTARVRFEDYRTVDGLRLPFLTTVRMDGLGDGISEADRERVRQALRQLEQVPPEQRAMVESMMQGQIEQARKVLEGEPVTIETVIRQVRVQTGTP